ncbi:MAG: hypothetical protein ACJA0I_001442, partial [Gammaproteobacteria bacterium]
LETGHSREPAPPHRIVGISIKSPLVICNFHVY